MKITDIHEIPFELYNLQGRLLKSSIPGDMDRFDKALSSEILTFFQDESNRRYVEDNNETKYRDVYRIKCQWRIII